MKNQLQEHDAFAEERAVSNRIQSLLLEDKKLEEQRRKREKEEEELRYKVMILKVLEQKVKEQAEQRDWIAGMKQRESRLQKTTDRKDTERQATKEEYSEIAEAKHRIRRAI